MRVAWETREWCVGGRICFNIGRRDGNDEGGKGGVKVRMGVG